MANKHWIEIWHPDQLKPSLQEITNLRPDQISRIVDFFDEEGIPWAFGAGERMPDQIEWRKEGREA
jgi:hypothetical protein